ncbi:ABC transporter ATP-binding protein [Marinigracilibium pacificum]|uniref:ABC transporter ATP-binding protein n=1 Tax=Marinigracilibium pacificum TaxID=2729599 RepID=A0A848IZF9_9BACT|nr:ABC transporter ATP-binding protein [Marinigracilibium pacificum]NMM49923.1 ABC transporter ATP-binding protein [Marinigracilibium pacificum]
MNTLEISNLSKTYPNGVNALSNISLSISNGMYGLLGANGAGKSTLMRTIATLQQPNCGSIKFNGINSIDNPQSLRSQLGYLPQEFGVYPKVSTLKLLDHIAILKGILNKNERKQQIEALLVKTNLYQHRKKSVFTFSGGMKQRFGIAQALLGDPKLILVDEPTAGLDPEERNRFLNLLSEIGENVIVILSTHIVEDVHSLCSRVAILDNGAIIKEGKPNDLVNELNGKIWIKKIDRFQRSAPNINGFISSRVIGGETLVRINSNSFPGSDYSPVAPSLEDVFFTTKNNSKTPQNR